MLTKKDFQGLANVCVSIVNDVDPYEVMEKIMIFCEKQNPRFNREKFKEWVRRGVLGESTKGLG